MLADKTPARRYYLGKSIVSLTLGLVFLLIPNLFTGIIDEFGRNFSYLLFGIMVLGAIFNYWQYKRSHEESVVYENIATAPAPLQLKAFKRGLILSYFAFPALAAMNAWDLNKLETGQVESVLIWFPFSYIYEYLGFWAAVISPLLLGVIAILVLRKKIVQMEITQTIK